MTAQKRSASTDPSANSLDAVSDRDFALEFLAVRLRSARCISVAARRGTRDLVFGAVSGFVTMSDRWSTGSSIMPQKKNPDAAELIRAKDRQDLRSATSR